MTQDLFSISQSNMPINKATSPFTKPEFDDLLLEETDQEHKLIVYNDDFNTFPHVISTLIEVCGHTMIQAEQCTLIIHYKGKCCVKLGSWDKLVAMRNAICDRGIQAEVEE